VSRRKVVFINPPDLPSILIVALFADATLTTIIFPDTVGFSVQAAVSYIF
jgi:hypothetical protein